MGLVSCLDHPKQESTVWQNVFVPPRYMFNYHCLPNFLKKSYIQGTKGWGPFKRSLPSLGFLPYLEGEKGWDETKQIHFYPFSQNKKVKVEHSE